MANKKKGKGFKAFVGALAIFGGLVIVGLGAAGVTYLVKPYNVDISWQQTETVDEGNQTVDDNTNVDTE